MQIPPFQKGLFLSLPFQAMALGLYLFQSAWLAIAIYHLSMILAIAVTMSSQQIRQIFKGYRFSTLLIFIGLCFQAGPCFYILDQSIDTSSWSSLFEKWGLTGLNLWAFIIYFSIINPIIEESFWRNLLGSHHRRPTLEDFLFGSYHSLILSFLMPIPYILLCVGCLTAIAYLWRQTTNRLGGTLIPIISHAIADLSIILVVYHIISL